MYMTLTGGGVGVGVGVLAGTVCALDSLASPKSISPHSATVVGIALFIDHLEVRIQGLG